MHSPEHNSSPLIDQYITIHSSRADEDVGDMPALLYGSLKPVPVEWNKHVAAPLVFDFPAHPRYLHRNKTIHGSLFAWRHVMHNLRADVLGHSVAHWPPV